MRETRTATIVFDTEMGWGSIENGRLGPRETAGVFERGRAALPTVLAALAARELPTTWAVVGALLDPRAADHLDHLPAPRVDQIRAALATARADTLFLPELGDALARAPRLEFGCHGWSHTRLDSPGLRADAVAADLALWREAVAARASEPLAMVCPRDIIGFPDTLAGAGVKALRVPPGHAGPPPAWARRLRWPRPARRAFLETDSGPICAVEGTLFFRPGRLRLAYSTLRAGHALRRHGTTVIWLHPFNFGEDPRLLGRFTHLLDRLAAARDAGVLEVVPLTRAVGVVA